MGKCMSATDQHPLDEEHWVCPMCGHDDIAVQASIPYIRLGKGHEFVQQSMKGRTEDSYVACCNRCQHVGPGRTFERRRAQRASY